MVRGDGSKSWQPDRSVRRETSINRGAWCGLADGSGRDLVARISETGESRRCGGVQDGVVHRSNIVI